MQATWSELFCSRRRCLLNNIPLSFAFSYLPLLKQEQKSLKKKVNVPRLLKNPHLKNREEMTSVSSIAVGEVMSLNLSHLLSRKNLKESLCFAYGPTGYKSFLLTNCSPILQLAYHVATKGLSNYLCTECISV